MSSNSELPSELGRGFNSRLYHFVVFLGKTCNPHLLQSTQLQLGTWHEGVGMSTYLVMCANGCHIGVCSPGSWECSGTNRLARGNNESAAPLKHSL